MIHIESLNDKEIANLINMNESTKDGIHQWFYKLGAHLSRSVLLEIRRIPRYGKKRIVKNPVTGLVFEHTASVPGETAANMFGNYAKGIAFKVSGSEMLFGDTVKYARDLELGTKGKKASSVVSNRKRILGSFRSSGGIPKSGESFARGEPGGIAPRPGLSIAIASNERNAYRDAVIAVEMAAG